MNDYKELIEVLKNAEHIALCGNGAFNTVLVERCYEAADAIEQLVKERDAAIKDMQDYQGNFCCYCKRKDTKECLFPEEVLLMCGKFEWRGVQNEID